MTTSNLFSLNTQDFLKGVLMAVLVPVMTIVTQSLQAGSLTFNWKAIGVAAIAGFVAYLTKNFLTPSSTTSNSPIAK